MPEYRIAKGQIDNELGSRAAAQALARNWQIAAQGSRLPSEAGDDLLLLLDIAARSANV